MTYYNKERIWLLVINTIDNLDRVARVRELTNMVSDINIKSSKTEEDRQRVKILIESYREVRDESLEAALFNLRELVLAMSSFSQ